MGSPAACAGVADGDYAVCRRMAGRYGYLGGTFAGHDYQDEPPSSPDGRMVER